MTALVLARSNPTETTLPVTVTDRGRKAERPLAEKATEVAVVTVTQNTETESCSIPPPNPYVHPCTLKGLTYVTSCGCGVCVGRPADKAGCRSQSSSMWGVTQRTTCLGHLQSPGGTQIANALRPKFKGPDGPKKSGRIPI